MIEKIRKKIINLKGKIITLEVDVGRNKTEKYIGFIDNVYTNIWTFKTSSDVKSFSYKDILIKSVIICPK